MALVYLAGPIDGIEPAQAMAWRNAVADLLLEEHGIGSYSPAHAFVLPPVNSVHPGSPQATISADNCSKVVAANRSTLRLCDGMFVNLSGPGRAFGTIREIEYARICPLPVVIWGPDALRHSIEAFDCAVVSDMEEAVGVMARAVAAQPTKETGL